MIDTYRRYIIYIGVGIGVFLLMYYRNIFDYITLDYIQERADHLRMIAHQYYTLSFFLFSFFFALATFFFLPITILLTVFAGFLFDVVVGTGAVLLGAAFGGAALFLIIRYCIGNHVQKKYAHMLEKFNTELEKYGAYYLLVLQILPITPTLLINLLAGMSTISLWTYLWTTVVGIIPGTLIYTLAGAQLHALDSLHAIMSWRMVLILCIVAFLLIIVLFVKKYRILKY